ncbi:DNA-directed RNA polymerase III subunit RPC4 [Camellia lanceoleosa]|uniref:DNA-directed RNA polymerase III subunit RPC4 n=1 Tax=Camellia lanceoleosa TaxID=1840588 RepID=A0ACC0H7N3_9ERIC|nr:DNA-directed RNA polymerase III subunit RPC4 [Camellia lanceoleosa]
MDPDQPPSNPRKVRFAPKGPPPRKKTKPTEPKTEVVDDGDDANDKDEAATSLLRRVNEHLGRRGPRVEKKSSVQVAFAHGGASSTSIRTYGIPREGNGGKSNGSGLKDSAADDDDEQLLFSLPSTAKPDGNPGSSVNAADALYQKKQKDYREPWDYHHTNYPISLPLRRPYSGNPELLDEAEFGHDVMNLEYDEKTINPALELGLLEENEKPQMIFLQIPANLPLVKRSANVYGKERTDSSKALVSKGASADAKGKAIADGLISLADTGASSAAKGKVTAGSSMPLGTGNASTWCCGLEELNGGYMGKMLVYKSGAIKWKLGEVIYDVSPGLSCACAQDAVAINTVDKDCCVVGELSKRAVLTPDIDSLLDNLIDLG